jgi:hypothetical protein
MFSAPARQDERNYGKGGPQDFFYGYWEVYESLESTERN